MTTKKFTVTITDTHEFSVVVHGADDAKQAETIVAALFDDINLSVAVDVERIDPDYPDASSIGELQEWALQRHDMIERTYKAEG